MAATTPTTLTARSLTDIVEITPSLLGFRPEESLVVMALADGRVGFTARVDLAAVPSGIHGRFLPMWRKFRDADYMVVAFSSDPELAWASLFLIDDALPACRRMLIHADDTHCHLFPGDEGEPYDPFAGRLVAEATVAGMEVLPSRGELHRLLEPTVEPSEVADALERVLSAGDVAQIIERARELVAAADAVGGAPTLDDATALGIASLAPEFLDEVILATTRENAPGRRDLWAAVVRSLVPKYSGGALAALGMAAWQCGQGALQVVCLERMVGRPADPLWAGVLDLINARVMPPTQWPQFAEEVRRVRDATARARPADASIAFDDSFIDEDRARVDAINRLARGDRRLMWTRASDHGRRPRGASGGRGRRSRSRKAS
ncbi:MAG: DUF4192 domain-containing protein [Propionibacteriaceae bacterium]|nr:DUF4192 domain-containing protein [Propionibacteriaceae bacterium]